MNFKNLPELLESGSFAHVTSDSREVRKGTVFVAVKGASQDGHDFVAQAVQDGAQAIVGERPTSEMKSGATPYIEVRDSREALGLLAARAHGDPSKKLKMIGVTGTSGKTTTTYIIESILKEAGYKVGVIGTVNFRFGEKVYPSTHTTPGAPELNALLAEMLKDGCTHVVMEVSSHALKQHRVTGIAFDSVVFNNLSREHLDFHPDMEDYFRSKAMLFKESVETAWAAKKHPAVAINIDDEFGGRLAKEVESAEGSQKPDRTVFFSLKASELKFTVSGIRGEGLGVRIESSLMGAFNAENILGAIAAALSIGVPQSKIRKGVRALAKVPGRLERVANSRGLHVVVDYAHKPDALDKVLRTLKAVKGDHRLITVFGCGGDRDRTKRPVMGKIACELSDAVFITSDNPRTESPAAIIDEIVAGTSGHANFKVEPDRAQAIASAVRSATPGDIVLIAGKGHEDYQIIGTTKSRFDDREIAAQAMAK